MRAKQFWRLENLKSFDDFLEKRFPDSRRKAYYLMAIHENLTSVSKLQLREIGWSKAIELVKVARRDGEGFKREVERHLTGKETEQWEIIYFKLYKSQLPVVEKALETAGLMLGNDKSRGYCLEMICADFLAGASVGEAQLQFCYAKPANSKPLRPETTSIQTGSGRIRDRPETRARTRWLAVSRNAGLRKP